MSECRQHESSIERLPADEIEQGERDRLLAHTESCPDCRRFVDLHYQLQDSELGEDLPEGAEFAVLRRSVLARIRAERKPAGRLFGGFGDFLRALVAQPVYATALAAMKSISMSHSGLARPATYIRVDAGR